MNFKKSFFLFFILIFSLLSKMICSGNKNTELIAFLDDMLPQDSFIIFKNTLTHKENLSPKAIVKALIKKQISGVTASPFSKNKNGITLISILLKEDSLFKCLLWCLKEYPQEMAHYIDNNKENIPEKYLPVNLFNTFRHTYLDYTIEFFIASRVIIPSAIAIQFIRSILNLSILPSTLEYDDLAELLPKLSGVSFKKVLYVVDRTLSQRLPSNKNIFYFFSSFCNLFNSCLEKIIIKEFKDFGESQTSICNNNKEIITLLRLLLMHGIIDIHDPNNIINEFFGPRLTLKRIFQDFNRALSNEIKVKGCLEYIMPHSFIKRFFQEREEGIIYSRLNNIIYKYETKFSDSIFNQPQEKFFSSSSPINENKRILWRGINASKPFLPLNEKQSEQIEKVLSGLYNTSYPTGKELYFVRDIATHKNYQLATIFNKYLFEQNKEFEKEVNLVNVPYMKHFVCVLYQNLTKFLIKKDLYYLPYNDLTFDSFEEIMYACHELFNRILEIEVNQALISLSPTYAHLFSSKLMGTIIRICLRQRNSNYTKFQNDLNTIIHNITILFSSFEEVEKLIIQHKNASFDELLGWCESTKRVQKYNSRTMEKKIKQAIHFHKEHCSHTYKEFPISEDFLATYNALGVRKLYEPHIENYSEADARNYRTTLEY